MKTIILTLALIAFVTISAFKIVGEKDKAIVNKIEGYYIFTDCKPASDYEYLGEVHTSGFMSLRSSSQYTDVRNVLIKKAKKEYPRADGLIFTFVTGSADRCEAIMIKE